MKLMNLWVVTTMVCSLVLLTSVSVQAADETITDAIEDVATYDYLSGETTVITSSPYIDVDNIDIMQSTYTQQGSQATVTLQVRGDIEDRGRIDYMEFDYDSLFNTLDSVDYMMTLTTMEQDSEQEYTVRYSNKTGQLTRGSETPVNLTSSDFSVAGDTLTVSFTLDSSQEAYESLVVESTYVKMNLTADNPDFSQLVILSDISPNPPLSIFAPDVPNIGSVGETIQFNASLSIEPLTGQPPYTYQWDFGDQTTSSALSPTHVYSEAGEYTYTFTVTDHGGATESESGIITIESENNGSNGSSTPMFLFLAILAIVIIIGVIIIIWIIRR